jgi:hypothetical protein
MYSYAVRDLQITQLSDEFGQSIIYLRCDCEYPSPQPPTRSRPWPDGTRTFRHSGAAPAVFEVP